LRRYIQEYFFTAQIAGWDIVPGKFGIPHGLVEGTLVRQGNAGEFKSWRLRIEGVIGILGASGGDIPDMGSGVLLSAKTVFGSTSDLFRLELRADFAIEVKTDTSFFRLAGSAELVYPCLAGDRIGGSLDLKAEIGDLIIDSLSGYVYFYCHVNGTDSPALEAELKSEGVVQFVKGVNLMDFELAFQAYKTFDNTSSDGGNATGDVETWRFAGSVAGTVVLGTPSTAEHGALVDFAFDTRDGSWAAAVGYEIVSEHVNMTLKAGTASYCTAEGTYIKGAISVKIGDEGYLYGSARGARNCGDYRATKGVLNVRAAVDEAKIKTSGMLMYLEDVRVQIRADSRDVLVTAEGFIEAQAELPVSEENPYFTPEPGYGKRRLLWAKDAVFEGKQNSPYRTNCFEARSYNPDFPNVVFKSINNESRVAAPTTWRVSEGAIASQECVVGDPGALTHCASGVAIENDASHPVCPDGEEAGHTRDKTSSVCMTKCLCVMCGGIW